MTNELVQYDKWTRPVMTNEIVQLGQKRPLEKVKAGEKDKKSEIRTYLPVFSPAPAWKVC